MKISFDLGKNGCHRPSGLGSRLIIVVRQVDKTLSLYHFTICLKYDDFSSGACLGCLNRFIVLTTPYQ